MRKKIEKFYEWCGIPNSYAGDNIAEVLSWFTIFFIACVIIVRLCIGMNDANDPNKCKAQSINDILLSPAYALGCNLAKDRFNIHLN